MCALLIFFTRRTAFFDSSRYTVVWMVVYAGRPKCFLDFPDGRRASGPKCLHDSQFQLRKFRLEQQIEAQQARRWDSHYLQWSSETEFAVPISIPIASPPMWRTHSTPACRVGTHVDTF